MQRHPIQKPNFFQWHLIMLICTPYQAAVEKNAKDLKDHIKELYWGTCSKVVLLGIRREGCSSSLCHVLAKVEGQSGGTCIGAKLLWWKPHCTWHIVRRSDCRCWNMSHDGGPNLQNHQGIMDFPIFVGLKSASFFSLLWFQSQFVRNVRTKQFCVVAQCWQLSSVTVVTLEECGWVMCICLI